MPFYERANEMKRMEFRVQFVVDQLTEEGAESLVAKLLAKTGSAKVNVVGFSRVGQETGVGWIPSLSRAAPQPLSDTVYSVTSVDETA
jgi:hypothetical protein